MIVWTHAVLDVLYAHVIYFCICTCSAQQSIFRMERHSRTAVIVSIIIMTVITMMMTFFTSSLFPSYKYEVIMLLRAVQVRLSLHCSSVLCKVSLSLHCSSVLCKVRLSLHCSSVLCRDCLSTVTVCCVETVSPL